MFSLLSIQLVSQEMSRGEIMKDRQFLIDKSEITAADSEGNFVSIRPHRINGTLRNYFVEFFDQLNFTERILINTENTTDILNVFILNGNVHVFIKEQIDRKISLRFDIINLKSKTKTEKSLYQIDKDRNSATYKALEDNYNITLDWASNITLSIPVFNRKNNYVVAKVFSKSLEDLSEQTFHVDHSDSYKDVKFLNVKSYKDKLYILFEIENDVNERYYKLIEKSSIGNRAMDIPTNIETFELINSKIRDDYYFISGLYSHHIDGGFDGFTYYRIDLETFAIQSQKQSVFLDERATKYFNGFFKGNRNVDINNLFIDKNRNLYVIGQFYDLRREYVPLAIPIAPVTVFGMAVFITVNPISYSYKIYDDLLMAKINSNGELEWDNMLELKQTEGISSKSNKRDTSTFSFFSNNQLNIFMNGYINMEKETLIVKQDKRLSKTNFYNIVVNSHGGITPYVLFPNEDSEILFRAERTIKSGNGIYILGQGNMRKQLLKIRL